MTPTVTYMTSAAIPTALGAFGYYMLNKCRTAYVQKDLESTVSDLEANTCPTKRLSVHFNDHPYTSTTNNVTYITVEGDHTAPDHTPLNTSSTSANTSNNYQTFGSYGMA